MKVKIKRRSRKPVHTLPKHKEYLDPIIHKVTDFDELAVDTETTGLNWSKGDCVFTISACFYDKKTQDYYPFCWEFPVDPKTRKVIPSKRDSFLALFIEWYTDPTITKILANAKFDIHMLEETFSLFPVGEVYDVLVAAWCCNTQEQSYGLKKLSKKYVDIDDNDEKDLKGAVQAARVKGKKLGINIGDNLAQDYWLPRYLDHKNNLNAEYAKLDAIRTLMLWHYYEDAMNHLEVRKAFDIEMELLPVLYAMEEKGIRFNEEKCVDGIAELTEAEEKCLINVRQSFNFPKLNLNSPKQLVQVLYGTDYQDTIFPLSVDECTSTGQPSTSTPTLETYKGIFEIDEILKYRGFNTGKKQYKNCLKAKVEDKSITLDDLPWLKVSSVHTNFNQIKTCTGRLSANNPPLQTIADPEKSSGLFVSDARALFGPREGYRWYCIDYKQLEARVFAEIAKEEEMIAAFSNPDIDPFTELGEQVYGGMFEAGKTRKITKNVFYCKIFCGGPDVLAKKYHVTPVSFAKEVLDGLGNRFPGIKKTQYELTGKGKRDGYIRTLFGRRISIDSNFAYRAVSYIVQGTAADLVKRAMIRCYEFIQACSYDISLVLSIHDELVFEIKEEHCFTPVIKTLQRIMEDNLDVLKIATPTEVERTITTWSSTEKRELKC